MADLSQLNIDWEHLSKYSKLTEVFIFKNRNNVNWNLIVRYQLLRNEAIDYFYRKKILKENWDLRRQVLSKNFIRKWKK